MSAATGRWLLLAAGVATVAAVAAAVHLDPPGEVRARRLDEQRVRDLAAIETSITEFKARQARLPASLDELASAGLRPPGKDPETASAYRFVCDYSTRNVIVEALPSDSAKRPTPVPAACLEISGSRLLTKSMLGIPNKASTPLLN